MLDMRLRPELDDPNDDRRREAPRDPRRDRGRRARRCWQAGGLFVIGTERHESRRIDNQLRGRSGRQGDPGALEVLLSRSKTT